MIGVTDDGVRLHPVELIEAVRDNQFRYLDEDVRDALMTGIGPRACKYHERVGDSYPIPQP
jgi:hypothetical protein